MFQSTKFRILIIILVVVLLITFVVVMLGNAQRNSSKSSNQPILSSSAVVNPSLLAGFESSPKVQKVGTGSVISPFVYFLDTKGNFAFINQDAKITATNSTIQSQDLFIPDSTVFLGNGKIILNQASKSFVYDIQKGSLQETPTGVFSLFPLVNGGVVEKYFYLYKSEQGVYSVATTSSLEFKDFRNIIKFDFAQLGNPSTIELRILNKIPHLVVYTIDQNIPNSKTVKIFRISDKLEQIADLVSVRSMLFGVQNIFYTSFKQDSADGEIYKQNLINFENPFDPSTKTLKWELALATDNIGGRPIAEKCSFDNTEASLVCPVKNINAEVTNAFVADKIVKFDLGSDTISYLFPDLSVSISKVLLNEANQLFAINQENHFLYKFLE